MYVCAKLLQSCLTLCDPMDYIACQAPLSKGFSKQEYWSGLPFPSPGEFLDPGITPISPTLAGRIFTAQLPGKPKKQEKVHNSWNQTRPEKDHTSLAFADRMNYCF